MLVVIIELLIGIVWTFFIPIGMVKLDSGSMAPIYNENSVVFYKIDKNI